MKRLGEEVDGCDLLQVVASGSHDEVKIAVAYATITFCHYGFQSSRGLLKSPSRTSRVTAKFPEAQPLAQQ